MLNFRATAALAAGIFVASLGSAVAAQDLPIEVQILSKSDMSSLRDDHCGAVEPDSAECLSMNLLGFFEIVEQRHFLRTVTIGRIYTLDPNSIEYLSSRDNVLEHELRHCREGMFHDAHENILPADSPARNFMLYAIERYDLAGTLTSTSYEVRPYVPGSYTCRLQSAERQASE